MHDRPALEGAQKLGSAARLFHAVRGVDCANVHHSLLVVAVVPVGSCAHGNGAAKLLQDADVAVHFAHAEDVLVVLEHGPGPRLEGVARRLRLTKGHCLARGVSKFGPAKGAVVASHVRDEGAVGREGPHGLDGHEVHTGKFNALEVHTPPRHGHHGGGVDAVAVTHRQRLEAAHARDCQHAPVAQLVAAAELEEAQVDAARERLYALVDDLAAAHGAQGVKGERQHLCQGAQEDVGDFAAVGHVELHEQRALAHQRTRSQVRNEARPRELHLGQGAVHRAAQDGVGDVGHHGLSVCDGGAELDGHFESAKARGGRPQRQEALGTDLREAIEAQVLQLLRLARQGQGRGPSALDARAQVEHPEPALVRGHEAHDALVAQAATLGEVKHLEKGAAGAELDEGRVVELLGPAEVEHAKGAAALGDPFKSRLRNVWHPAHVEICQGGHALPEACDA